METSGGLGAFIVLGVLALCVAGVAGSVLASNVVKERKASLAEVSSKNDATVKRAAELQAVRRLPDASPRSAPAR